MKQDLEATYEFADGTFRFSVAGDGLLVLGELVIRAEWPRPAIIAATGRLLQQIGLSFVEAAKGDKPDAPPRDIDVSSVMANRRALAQGLRRRIGRHR